jgi:hypothetical protein
MESQTTNRHVSRRLSVHRRLAMSSRFSILVLGILMSIAMGGFAGAAESAIEYEKVLLPIVLSQQLPGAFGSVWTSEFWLRNDGSQPVDVQGYIWCGVCFDPSPPPPAVPPNVTFRPRLYDEPPGLQGFFLLVDRRYASDVAFSLRVRDLSRQSMTWGTEVPVVRKEQFRSGKLSLIDVPTGSGFRQVLRIYDLDGSRVAQITIRIYKVNPDRTLPFPDPDPLLGSAVRSFRIPSPNVAAIYPGYIEVADLNAIAPLSGTERVRIEIEPVTPGLQYWAFAAVVNNDTQHLTVISPNP